MTDSRALWGVETPGVAAERSGEAPAAAATHRQYLSCFWAASANQAPPEAVTAALNLSHPFAVSHNVFVINSM